MIYCREEYDKIKLLNPKRYILVTSLGLTPSHKEELLQILSPFCKYTSDIIGCDELNGLLRKHPEIEKGHYKLWLTSSAVLEKILHNDIYNRSEIAKDMILMKLKLFVQSKAYYKALKILDKSNCCIISGIPGIGKTTLAEMLLIAYLDRGYEVIKIAQNINEAYNVYSSGKKQIFLYDDFLGQTGLELKLAKNEDQDILNFIRHIGKGSASKFILTTREYILNQAKSTYEALARSNIDINKYTIVINDYSTHDKAKILFNHLYYQNLTTPYIENLLNNNISKIVSHVNYNPRIIEIMTNNLLPKNPEHFYSNFIMNLDSPNYIWKFAFENHISNEARDMLILMTTLPFKSELNNVRILMDAEDSDTEEKKDKFIEKEFDEQMIADMFDALVK